MRPDTDNFLFPLRRLSPPPPANSPPAKTAVGSNTLPEAGYARSTDENCPTVCVACFSPSPPYYSSPADISIPTYPPLRVLPHLKHRNVYSAVK